MPSRRGTSPCPRRPGRRSRPRAWRRSRPPARLPSPRTPCTRSSSGLSSKPCFADVGDVEHGLRGEQAAAAAAAPSRRALEPDRARRACASSSAVSHALEQRRPASCASLSPGARRLADAVLGASRPTQVGERELGVDHLDVADRIDLACSTWITLASSKQRTTLAIASVSRMLARNLLPRPSPFEAPATSPAMSTNSTIAGMHLLRLVDRGELAPGAGRAPRRRRRWARWCRTDSSPPRCRPW